MVNRKSLCTDACLKGLSALESLQSLDFKISVFISEILPGAFEICLNFKDKEIKTVYDPKA